MTSLWRNVAFLRLWIASTVSSLGSKITATALPLTAAVTLQATPGQMAMLVMAGQLPDLVFGLLAGSWVDRGRHRTFLVGSDLGRAMLLAIIPLSAVFGVLNLPILVAVAFGSGALSVFFSVASVAVLPSIVPQEQFVDANAKLSMSDSVAALGGPGVAGVLVQLMTAPKAILIDSISYLISAFSLKGIGGPATSKPSDDPRRSLLDDIREGLRELVATPLLRALTVSSAVFAAGLAMQGTVLMLFLTRTLELSAATIGIVLMFGGAGSLVGAGLSGWISRRIGAGPAIIGGTLIEVLAACSIPLSAASQDPAPILAMGQLLNGIGISIYAVNHVSLRQRIVRAEVLGRITAGRRFLTFCVAPVGAILGAQIADRYGLTETLYAAAALLLAGTLAMWASPVRDVRQTIGGT